MGGRDRLIATDPATAPATGIRTGSARHFACTRCGRCCNRSPEVLLSEAAALSDVFVFSLMFRIYVLPRTLAGYLELHPGERDAGERYYEKKRLLSAYAARTYPARMRHGGRQMESMRYLMVSALSLDLGFGTCTARRSDGCGIYDRRPLACRTVPFHYSRTEASAETDLAAFLARQGHDCDSGQAAPVVLRSGRIVDPDIRQARADALAATRHESEWKEAILRRMRPDVSVESSLPSLREVEANARLGATTTSMRVAWRIAADAGLIAAGESRALVARQLALIERHLAAADCPPDARSALVGMQSEYRETLRGPRDF